MKRRAEELLAQVIPLTGGKQKNACDRDRRWVGAGGASRR